MGDPILWSFTAGVACGLGAVAGTLLVRHLLNERKRTYIPNPKFENVRVTVDGKPLQQFENVRLHDTVLAHSIMEKLGDTPSLKPVAAEFLQSAYGELLTELKAWVRAKATEQKTSQAAVMEALGIETGHGRKYIARLVYEGRRPSPEAADSIMCAMGLAREQRDKLNERLRRELNRPVA